MNHNFVDVMAHITFIFVFNLEFPVMCGFCGCDWPVIRVPDVLFDRTTVTCGQIQNHLLLKMNDLLVSYSMKFENFHLLVHNLLNSFLGKLGTHPRSQTNLTSLGIFPFLALRKLPRSQL